MQKRLNKHLLRVGDLVVVTEHHEAQVYTFAGLEGHTVMFQWYEGSRHCSCGLDTDRLYQPTTEQIQYSIKANGRLLAANEVLDWA